MKTLALSLLIPLLSGSCLAQQPDTIAPAPGTEEWYWQRAVKLYPDAEYKDTEFFKEMVKIAAWLGETKDPMLALPDKKLRIAQMTAAKLGISARVSQSPPRTVIVKPAVPVKDPGPQVNPPELMKLIEEKVSAPGKEVKTSKAPRKATNVVDLVSVLQESLNAQTKAEGKAKKSKSRSHAPHRKAA